MATIKLESHKDEVIKDLENKIVLALTQCGMEAVNFAQDECPIDQGHLIGSITFAVKEDEQTMYVGTNMEYAPYVEFGTGVYTDGGRKTPWTYQDGKGNWHKTNGQKAQPFIKPAIDKHIDVYKQVIEDTLRG